MESCRRGSFAGKEFNGSIYLKVICLLLLQLPLRTVDGP
jgi:hypothetical protein